MTFSADDVVAVITWLVPGFIALKILYVFGFRSKRSDLEWAVWSLIGSAVIAPFTAWTIQRLEESFPSLGVSGLATVADRVKTCVAPILSGSKDGQLDGVAKCASDALAKQATDVWTVAVGLGLGVVLGVILLIGWTLISRINPGLSAKAFATVWDSVLTKFDKGPWVEVTVGDGRRLSGILEELASDVETETVDIFISKPAWIGSDGQPVTLGEVVGVWLPRSEVKTMVVVRQS
jgi:Family of unknown function (DUF6338)